jgi:hypothetical protein
MIFKWTDLSEEEKTDLLVTRTEKRIELTVNTIRRINIGE